MEIRAGSTSDTRGNLFSLSPLPSPFLPFPASFLNRPSVRRGAAKIRKLTMLARGEMKMRQRNCQYRHPRFSLLRRPPSVLSRLSDTGIIVKIRSILPFHRYTEKKKCRSKKIIQLYATGSQVYRAYIKQISC